VIRPALPALAAVLAASCGYQVGGLYAPYREGVRVEIFDNLSERRTHEFELTRIVTRELASRGIRVNVPGAPYTLTGRIRDLRTPTVVEGRADETLVGSLSVQVEIELSDSREELLWKDAKVETVRWAALRGESPETARREAFDRLARWILTRFEKEW